MNRILLSLFGALFLAPVLLKSQDIRKSASLIIAIGKYAPETNWPSISSLNDVPLVKEAWAIQHLDTTSSSMETLINENAKYKDIKEALDRLADRAQPGGIVYFHFSGHGQQVMDKNGDELDGYDEAIVPYDADMKYSNSYTGQRHLIDDELEVAFNKIRTKLGRTGQLLVILDACHSGSGTRGVNLGVRGTEGKIAPDTYRPSNRQRTDDFEFTTTKESENMAPMLALYACSPNELNYEYKGDPNKPVGPLSYAFASVFPSMDRNTNCAQLFNAIRAKMGEIASKQAPQVEGDLTQPLLGGQLTGMQTFYGVLNATDSMNIVISTGLMNGNFPGTKVKLYGFGQSDTTGITPLAEGEIVSSTMLTAQVKLLPHRESTDFIRNASVYVTEKSFGEYRIKLRIDLPAGALKDALLKEVARIKAVELVDKHYDISIQFEKDKSISLVTNEDRVLDYQRPASCDKSELNALDPANPVNCAKNIVSEYLVPYAQGKFLKKAIAEKRGTQLKLEIVPIDTTPAGEFKKALSPSLFKKKNGSIVIKEGQAFVFRVINTGKEKAYFTILDIQPDNQTNLCMPSCQYHQHPSELFVEAGDSLLISNVVFIMCPPYGSEVFKLIADNEPIDLRPIVASRGAKGPSKPHSPFEELFQESYDMSKANSRGARAHPLPPDDVFIETVVFYNRPK